MLLKGRASKSAFSRRALRRLRANDLGKRTADGDPRPGNLSGLLLGQTVVKIDYANYQLDL